MKTDVLICLFAHGNLAGALKSVTENLGMHTKDFFCFSNQKKSIEKIEEEILLLIENKTPKNILIFVDLAGGSCWLSANRLKRENNNIDIIGGVNVPMLVSFFINSQRMDWSSLLEKVIADGKKGITGQ
jgi:PTS system mannose-specific IIA component